MILEIITLVILAVIVVILARKLPQIVATQVAEGPHHLAHEDHEGDMEKAEKLFAQENYVEAEKYYLKAIVLDPNNAKIYNRLGVIYLDKRYYNDALESFKAALKMGNKIPSRHINVGVVYTKLGKWGLAARYFRNALKLKPNERHYQQLLKNAEDKMKEKRKEL